MPTKIIKSYSELITLPTFDERFNYLKLNGSVGEELFGPYRYLRQAFYSSYEWRKFKDSILIRDNGCEMGLIGFDIPSFATIHHINPILDDDILDRNLDVLLNPENTITVSSQLHKRIHYGDYSEIFTGLVERKEGDTKLW